MTPRSPRSSIQIPAPWDMSKTIKDYKTCPRAQINPTCVATLNRDTLGTVDFYLNGGNGQPGCLVIPCDHGFGYLFLTDLNNRNLAGSGIEYRYVLL